MKTLLNEMTTYTMQDLEGFFAPIATRFPSLGKAFQTSTSHYFYDTGTGKVIQCSLTMYKILKCWELNREFNSIVALSIPEDEIINELSELWSVVGDENIMQAIPIEEFHVLEDVENYINTHVNMITLELTERCNLRCRYCVYDDDMDTHRGFGSRDMTFETAKKAIDLIVKHSTELEPEKYLILSFYGGEPLLQFNLIKQCVEYAESQNVKRKWLFSITTNCTLLTDEMVKCFAEKGFALTASIDGYKEIHDANRVSSSGTGSFDRAIRNLEKLALAYKENGVEDSRISINSVMTPPYDFEKLDRIQRFFSSLKWLPENVRITWSYAQPPSEIIKQETEREIARVELGDAKDLDPITEWHYEKMSLSEGNLFTREGETRSLRVIQERRITEKPTNTAHLNACCLPGSNRVYVVADGSLQICERIGKSPAIGNVNDGYDFAAIRRYFFDEYIEQSLPYCKDCWAVQMCAVCYMYCYNNDVIDMDKKSLYCAKTRFLRERALIKYHDLLENNLDGLMNFLELNHNNTVI